MRLRKAFGKKSDWRFRCDYLGIILLISSTNRENYGMIDKNYQGSESRQEMHFMKPHRLHWWPLGLPCIPAQFIACASHLRTNNRAVALYIKKHASKNVTVDCSPEICVISIIFKMFPYNISTGLLNNILQFFSMITRVVQQKSLVN